jgi:hypothetical protein
MDEITVSCRLLVSRATDWAGQAQLDAYLIGSGTNSIKAALESDRTLGGKCDDSNVTRISGYHQYEVGSTYYYGAEISVHVIGSG